MSRKIDVVSGTGHRFAFLPVATSGIKREKAQLFGLADFLGDALETRLPPAAAQLLGTELKYTRQWIEGKENFRWLRMRFDERQTAQRKGQTFTIAGIWLAIETNTGSLSDGEERSRTRTETLEAARTTPPPPYVHEDLDPHRDQLPHRIDIVEVFPDASDLFKALRIERYNIELNWNRGGLQDGAADKRIQSQLIVDYGNSRTAAMILDHAPEGREGGLAQLSTLIDLNSQLEDSGNQLKDPLKFDQNEYIADSWITLKQARFEDATGGAFVPMVDYEYGPAPRQSFLSRLFGRSKRIGHVTKVERQPYMFRELAPVAMGQPGHDLVSSFDVDYNVPYFVPSPKRVVWDEKPRRIGTGAASWMMLKTDRQNRRDIGNLNGEVLRYFPISEDDRPDYRSDPDHTNDFDHDVSSWPIEKQQLPDTTNAEYSPADMLTFGALHIIEKAYRQLNAIERMSFGRRELSEIVLTYPPGWTLKEKQNFLAAWKWAAGIFSVAHFPLDRRPELHVKLSLDEAVASQLPVIYADTWHSGGNVEEWLDLFGSTRADGRNSCRVLAVDIGGGTVDTSIVDYFSSVSDAKNKTRISPKIILADSTTQAGDKLIQGLIDEVLIAKLNEELKSDEERLAFSNHLRGDGGKIVEQNKLEVLQKTIFRPIVLSWLSQLDSSSGVRKNGGIIESSVETTGVAPGQIEKLNKDLKYHLEGNRDFWPVGRKIQVSFSDISEVIDQWIEPTVERTINYLCGLNCDVVVITGKPSELDHVAKKFRAVLPIDPGKIIFAKGFYVGEALPIAANFGHDKIVPDAKLMTVTGAVIKEATSVNSVLSNTGNAPLLEGWNIDATQAHIDFAKHYWYREYGNSGQEPEELMAPDQDDCEFKIDTSIVRFSRSKFSGDRRETVMALKLRSEIGLEVDPNQPLTVRMSRTAFDDTDEEHSSLATDQPVLISIEGNYADGSPVSTDPRDDWEFNIEPIYEN